MVGKTGDQKERTANRVGNRVVGEVPGAGGTQTTNSTVALQQRASVNLVLFLWKTGQQQWITEDLSAGNEMMTMGSG